MVHFRYSTLSVEYLCIIFDIKFKSELRVRMLDIDQKIFRDNKKKINNSSYFVFSPLKKGTGSRPSAFS